LKASQTGVIAFAAILLLLPVVAGDFFCVFIAEIFIWGLFAMSFAMVYGYGGMLSFAQAVFFGAGCYGFNLGTFYFNFNTWGAIVSAAVTAMAFALPVGYIATRVKQHHFLLVTVIISVLISTTFASGHWRWIAGPFVTRSLTFVPELPLAVATLSFLDTTVTYYFTVAMVAIVFGLARMLVHSPFGGALLAIRDNETRSQLVGLNVNTLRWMMFVAAAGVAGCSGALYALLARFTSLSFWHWTYSGKAVVMAIIGGASSLAGPFVGTAFYMIVTEHLSRYFEQFIVIFGILMLIIIRYAPEGLWGLILRGYRAVVGVKAS
jgi:branched-chain amino acid transport system permease protein